MNLFPRPTFTFTQGILPLKTGSFLILRTRLALEIVILYI
jgi:hypothetical protein